MEKFIPGLKIKLSFKDELSLGLEIIIDELRKVREKIIARSDVKKLLERIFGIIIVIMITLTCLWSARMSYQSNVIKESQLKADKKMDDIIEEIHKLGMYQDMMYMTDSELNEKIKYLFRVHSGSIVVDDIINKIGGQK